MSAYCAIQVDYYSDYIDIYLPLTFKGLVHSLDTLAEDTFIRGALLYDNEEVDIIRVFY